MCAWGCVRGGVFVCVRIRVNLFEPMYVRLCMCVSACVYLPFVSVCA